MPGDIVLVQDFSKKSKFDPIFLPASFVVVEHQDEFKSVLVERLNVLKIVLGYLDDVKEFHGNPHSDNESSSTRNETLTSKVEETNQQDLIDEKMAMLVRKTKLITPHEAEKIIKGAHSDRKTN